MTSDWLLKKSWNMLLALGTLESLKHLKLLAMNLRVAQFILLLASETAYTLDPGHELKDLQQMIFHDMSKVVL